MNNSDIAAYHKEISGRPVGDRIALWAEKFEGAPYDPDPAGEYVTKRAIVADERVDCMYLTFRSVELALGRTPEEAIDIALGKRFKSMGLLKNGQIVNYDDRYRYGEDMLDSGKWGREITADIGDLTLLRGSRGREKVAIISKESLKRTTKAESLLLNGDLIFFVKFPGKRLADEIVGHIGIIKREGRAVYLIHASGNKNNGGLVKKVLFREYLRSMPFAGIRVSRFD